MTAPGFSKGESQSAAPVPAALVSAFEAPPIPVHPVFPKFCPTCGTPWQPEWTACQACAFHAAHVRPPLDMTEENRSIKSAVALYFTLLGVCALGMIFASSANELTVQLSVTIGLSLVTLIWCIASWRSVLPALARLARPGWFAAALGISLVTFAIATGVITTLQHLMQLPSARMSDSFLKAGYGWGMVILCVCVQPAIIEELAFRGVILGALQKALSPVEAILVSAMMFMILHLSVARFPHTFALGVAAGYLRTRTRSLYPGMVMHFSHNFLCVIAEIVMKSAGA